MAMSSSKAEINEVQRFLEKISQDLQVIKATQQKHTEVTTDLNQRLNNLEVTIGAEDSTQHAHGQGQVKTDMSRGQQSAEASGETPFASIQTDQVQAKYQVVRDSLQRQKLPSDVYLSATKTGISAQSKEVANILSNVAKYGETALKVADVLSEKSSLDEVKAELEDLVVVLLAQTRYIQEEYAGLVVQGTFGTRTQKVFRSLQKHTSAFTPSVLEQVKTAAQLATLADPADRPSGRGDFHQRNNRNYPGTRGGYFGGRGRPYQHSHFPHNNFRGRGQGQFGFPQRDIPHDCIEPAEN